MYFACVCVCVCARALFARANRTSFLRGCILTTNYFYISEICVEKDQRSKRSQISFKNQVGIFLTLSHWAPINRALNLSLIIIKKKKNKTIQLSKKILDFIKQYT